MQILGKFVEWVKDYKKVLAWAALGVISIAVITGTFWNHFGVNASTCADDGCSMVVLTPIVPQENIIRGTHMGGNIFYVEFPFDTRQAKIKTCGVRIAQTPEPSFFEIRLDVPQCTPIHLVFSGISYILIL